MIHVNIIGFCEPFISHFVRAKKKKKKNREKVKPRVFKKFVHFIQPPSGTFSSFSLTRKVNILKKTETVWSLRAVLSQDDNITRC